MSPSLSLCPGFKQVEAFGPDEDYEDEDEEVSYVVLDLGAIEPTLVPGSTGYRLIGLDTPTPFLQLQGTIFKGRHDVLLGTEMLFTDDKDNHDWSKRSVVHVSNTEQRICFNEVNLQPKDPSDKWNERGAEDGEAAATAAQDENPHQIDRLTGKLAPLTRAPRAKGESSKPKKAPAEKAKAKSKSKSKGKGKGKAKETDPEEMQIDNESGEDDVAMDIANA